jgi:hypothetical protein
VLVKEVFKTATQEMTTGTVSHANELKGWFVMVKDSAGRYPATPYGAMGGGGRGSTLPAPQRRHPPTTD